MNKFKKSILVFIALLGLNYQAETFNAADTSSARAVTTVAPCSTSGTRKANTTVDIGFDSSYANRKYYAKTNATKQLVLVTADQIILQDDNKEPVKSSGRYCSDEAKVSGVEKSNLDEGHAIADSLGGASNSYNITPQDSTVNRSGTQYKFEEEIRKAELSNKQVTAFRYEIKYPNTTTMTPSSYKVSYKIDGTLKTYSFSNSTGTTKPATNSSTKKNGWYWGSKAYNSKGNYLYSKYTDGKVVETRLYKTKKATKANLLVQTKYSKGKRTEKVTYKSGKVVQRQTYYSNGKSKKLTKYHSNGKNKEVRDYRSTGKLKTVKKYNTKGKLTSTKQYTEDGEAATAKCKDGTLSSSKTRRGTCSGHKGVETWY